MKMSHPEYTFQIEFKECVIQRIIIEAPQIFAAMVYDLKNQVDHHEGKWVLSDKNEILNIADECELIMDIFDLDINQKKILNTLYHDLEKEINDTELLLEWRKINTILMNLMEQTVDNLGYDITYKEIDLKSVFKTADVHFRKNSEDYLQYLLEYMDLLVEVQHIKIFVLVNITSFLSCEEVKYLYEQAFYKKYHLLLLDSQDITIDDGVEEKIIIDKEYCVIRTNVE